MSEDVEKVLNAVTDSVPKAEPTMRHVIEPPFSVTVEGNMVHVDAACPALWGSDKSAAVRLSFTPGAAKALSQFLNRLEFSDGDVKSHRIN